MCLLFPMYVYFVPVGATVAEKKAVLCVPNAGVVAASSIIYRYM